MTARRRVRGVARAMLRLYPSVFRERYGAAYLAAAEHIWERERSRARDPLAALRLVRVLVIDAVRAVPVERRKAAPDQRRGAHDVTTLFTGLDRDGGQAVRALLRRPGYALLVMLTLGLGIGASTAVFGALDRIVLRPLPYADGDRLVYLELHHPARGWRMSPFDEILVRWRAGAVTLDAIETHRTLSAVRTGDSGAEILRVTGYSAGLPGLLGVRPVRGRLPTAADAAADAPPTVVLSESFWRAQYGAGESAIGRTLRLNDTVFTIAGVWPAAAPLGFDRPPELFRVLPAAAEAPQGDVTRVLARLAPGARPELVQAELAPLLHGVEDVLEGVVPVVAAPYSQLGEAYVRGLLVVSAAALILLIVAVVNAANLVLARNAARGAETRIRLALGSSQLRVLRMYLLESTLLAGSGLACGLVVSVLLERGLAALGAGRLVPATATGMQAGALLLAVALSAAAALVCALVPMLQLRRAASGDAAAAWSQSRTTSVPSRIRALLVTGQTALAVVLAAGAALVTRSMLEVFAVDTGMQLEQLAIISIRAPETVYSSPDARRVYFEQVRAALEALPGAADVTVAPNPPLGFSVRGGVPFLDGETEPRDAATDAAFTAVTGAEPNWFDVTGTRILAGRTFEPREAGSVIVNEAFARARGGNVLGRSLRFPGDSVTRTIIGVAANVSASGLTSGNTGAQLYYPRDFDATSSYQRFVVRARGDAESLLLAARTAVHAIDRDVPLRESRTGRDMIRAQTARFRFLAVLLGGFAGLGLLFAIAGVYGAVSLEVQRRTRELGVRMALGASAPQIATSVVRRGLSPAAAGAVIGLVVVLAAAPLLEAVLFSVPARDPLSALAGALIVLGTALLACLVPAARAARVDPAITLHAE